MSWKGVATSIAVEVDDFLILLQTERAAQRVMEGVTICFEQRLGLPVNRGKSHGAPIQDVKFLGFQILRGRIRMSTKARQRCKDQGRRLTPRNNGQSMYRPVCAVLSGGGGIIARFLPGLSIAAA
jgi:hypothetical protein